MSTVGWLSMQVVDNSVRPWLSGPPRQPGLGHEVPSLDETMDMIP